MQVVYAVVAAFDLITTFTVYLDDPIDGHETRGKMPAWYVHHPISFPSDAAS